MAKNFTNYAFTNSVKAEQEAKLRAIEEEKRKAEEARMELANKMAKKKAQIEAQEKAEEEAMALSRASNESLDIPEDDPAQLALWV